MITKDFLTFYEDYCNKWREFAKKLDYEIKEYDLYYAKQSILGWKQSKIWLRFEYDKKIVLSENNVNIKIPKIKINVKDPDFVKDSAKIIIEVNPCGFYNLKSSIATLNYFSLIKNEIRDLGYFEKYYVPKKGEMKPFRYIYNSKPLENLDDLIDVMVKFRDIVIDKKT